MITDVDTYFLKGCGRCERFDTPDCATQAWAEGLETLREICRGAGLEETVRWGHPCYRHGGRNVAIIGALRHDFRLSFFEAGLMRDPLGVLERQGPNTQHAGMFRFTDVDGPARLAETITTYLREAKDYAEKGLRAPPAEGELVLPAELIDALDADPELAEAFRGLTPGRQKSYVIHLSSAKTPETRIRRIARARGKILEGKGAQER